MKRLLLLISAVLICCGSSPEPEIPLQPIPDSCPNNLPIDPTTGRCNVDVSVTCRFDSTGQISADTSDPEFRCVNGLWFQVRFYDEGTIKNPVDE